jgi:hypothetical protein
MPLTLIISQTTQIDSQFFVVLGTNQWLKSISTHWHARFSSAIQPQSISCNHAVDVWICLLLPKIGTVSFRLPRVHALGTLTRHA